MTSRPVVFPGLPVLFGASLIGAVVVAVLLVHEPRMSLGIVLGLIGLLVGLLLVLPVGGADVPIVISLLNAFTGLTVAAGGYVLSNVLLLIAGTLAVTAVYLAGSVGGSLIEFGRNLYGLITTAGLPLLLGLNVRSMREVVRQAEERAVEERRRRESETRAARADERGAIARELHDVVAHHVASIVLRIGVARHVLPDVTPAVADVFDDVHATGTAALTDLGDPS